MKNYLEQLNITVVSSAEGYTSSTTLSAETDVKIQDNKVWDTSSSANAFNSLTAGDVIRMTGWDEEENNGIFIVAEVESSGEWISLDRPLLEQTSVSSPGITMYDTPESWTVSGVAISESRVSAALNLSNPAAFSSTYFRVTDDDTVSSFAVFTEDSLGDDIAVYWADLSEG